MRISVGPSPREISNRIGSWPPEPLGYFRSNKVPDPGTPSVTLRMTLNRADSGDSEHESGAETDGC